MLNHRGFTLIELMVTIAVFAILIMLALPSFSVWTSNMRIRGAAEAVQNGIQLARQTAIAHNTQVMFVFPNAGSLDYLVYELASPGALPASFTAPVVSGATPEAILIQQYNQAEGASNTAVAIAGAGGAPDPTAYMVTFGSLGQVVGNPDGTNYPRMITVNSAISTDPAIRPLRVVIWSGGGTKVCDTAVPVANIGDTRVCPDPSTLL